MILAAVWAAVIVAINPLGDFCVNDDWSFVRMAEILWSEGRIPATGWGKGGPSAIVHVLWGSLFAFVGGFTPTVFRLSVLTLGVTGSSLLLLLLRLSGASPWIALWGTLTLVFNPLFLSQCFTFMTDITFLCATLAALLFLYMGMEEGKTGLVAVGLIFALTAILTRQIGIVIPLGFLAVCLLHPRGRKPGLWKTALLVAGLNVLPWMAYEGYLAAVGSTPVTKHAVFEHILSRPVDEGLAGYPAYLAHRFFLVIMGYCGFLLSPILALPYHRYVNQRWFRYAVMGLTGCLVAVEAVILIGGVELPVALHRNVVYDIGIGPLLLKDTYVLGIRRTAGLPSWLFYLIVWWAALGAVVLLWRAATTVGRAIRARVGSERPPNGVLGMLALSMAVAYTGIILLTGFHDRYLIPVCALLIVWLLADDGEAPSGRVVPRTVVPAMLPLLCMAMFSVAGVRDFLELKRAQLKAQDYVVHNLSTSPCNFDGGFEFNGYHCNRKDFRPSEGLSWWWVDREDYLIALGPMPGYTVIHSFPFARWIGSDGSVFVLQPMQKPHSATTGRP